ncbi:MAG: FG-GAP-like repeat-containing protein [Bacteroidales bacterium]|nr:FG-GAP-like repeat-containing protein [Bacteroidales bacterium]MCF8403614.1 FG-GAP-like repeat-containing protein [Bacteroidales bacterium]
MKQLLSSPQTFIFVFLIIFSFQMNAQLFVDINAGLVNLENSSVSWGDYDNDKDMDILICGKSSGGSFLTRIYKNDGGLFTDINAGLSGINMGVVQWGDYDNDGDLDILATGENLEQTAIIYRNDNGIFSSIQLDYFDGFSFACWGDYDNDGDLDAFITGNWNSVLYRNDGQDQFIDSGNEFTMMNSAKADWGDYDGDGDLDLLLTGDTGGGMKMYLYVNENNGFTPQELANMGLSAGSVQWGDYDSDGDLDILIMGFNDWVEPQAYIYRNDENLAFVNIYAGLAPVAVGNAMWADYDNDGDLDCALTGKLSGCGVFATEIYRNDGNDYFNSLNAGIADGEYSCLAWGDYDNDTDLDLIVAGSSYSGGPFTKIYRNDAALPNFLPEPPQNLYYDFADDRTILSWDAGSDLQTPVNGLTYNIRIGTESLSCDNLSPMAHMDNGYRKIVKAGNTSRSNSWMVEGLIPGQTYYWSVQTIDNTFAASEFSDEQSFVYSITGITKTSNLNEELFYPNPAKDVIYINSMVDLKGTSIKLFTHSGEIIRQEALNANRQINIYDLSPGLYFLQLSSEPTQMLNKLIIR